MYELGSDEEEAIKCLIKSKQLFRYQLDHETNCRRFEKLFAEKLGHQDSLLLSSGTNALIISMLALDIGPGDEVLVSSFNFISVILSIVMVGAVPKLVEPDDDLLITVDSIKRKKTEKTRAMIMVYLDGIDNHSRSVAEYLKHEQIHIIEDCSQSMGGKNQHLPDVGRRGEYACYSLNQSKIISSGEGGLVGVNDQREWLKILALHDSPVQIGPTFKNDFAQMKKIIGISSRVSEVTAVMAETQLKKLEKIIVRLKDNKQKLIEEFNERKLGEMLPVSIEQDLCGTSLWVRLDSMDEIKKVMLELSKRHMISIPQLSRPGFHPWQFNKMLRLEVLPRYLQANFNQDSFNDFRTENLFSTVEKLSCVVKVEVPY